MTTIAKTIAAMCVSYIQRVGEEPRHLYLGYAERVLMRHESEHLIHGPGPNGDTAVRWQNMAVYYVDATHHLAVA